VTLSTPIQQRFSQLQQQGRCALMPFLMAGDAELTITGATLLALQEAGADMIELGIPYSDPLADGPVIQASASLLEMLTGLMAAFLPEKGLLLWAFGFGVLHLVYGVILYWKYERNRATSR